MAKRRDWQVWGWVVVVAVLSGGPARASDLAMFDYEWTGDAGFLVRGSFSFDETTAPAVIVELADRPTEDLLALDASFFDPSGALLGAFPIVDASVSAYEFLSFEFDVASETLVDFFDVGQVEAGAGLFLQGDPGVGLNLIEVGEGILDGGGTLSVSRVPEPGQALLLLGLGAAIATRRGGRALVPGLARRA